MLPYQIRDASKVRITSAFGSRTINGKTENHGGIDLVGEGGKNIVSVSDGVVRSSAMLSRETDKTGTWTYGNYIIITDADGVQYLYAHLRMRLMQKGERVRAGELIGVEGSTGNSSGSHLHFEVRKDGAKINPAEYLGLTNKIMTIGAKSCNYSAYVRRVCGLEAQTIDHINKYQYAADLWYKLWANMPPSAPAAQFADAKEHVIKACGLEGRTAAYIGDYRFAADLWRKLAGRIVG